MEIKDITEKELKILISKANSWDNVERYFTQDKDIKSYYEISKQECYDNNCQSASAMVIGVVENLMEKIEGSSCVGNCKCKDRAYYM